MEPVTQLYLIRHAPAEERGAAWPDDALRPLTAKGAKRMRQAAKGLSRLGVDARLVLFSPLVRTQQTAEIVAAALEHPVLVACEALAPGGRVAAALIEAGTAAHHSGIALVGHEPDLGAFAAHLLGARRSLAFRKGCVCRIDVPSITSPGRGELRWFLTPDILRRIRR